ncbi:MAG: T9SS type A sorting domain-containing protein [Fimbriimonadaceae bacterium]|nr:T9SS type A sorting domain-containing protein [Chitinophagales bacterium]
MHSILFTMVFIFCVTKLFAQETLLNLKYNSALFNEEKKIGDFRDIGLTRDTLCLPFFDDFSNTSVFLDSVDAICNDTVYNGNISSVYPNHLFWVDSGAYINRTYPILPPTYGVATLDGLNKFGKPYNDEDDYGIADTLTSKPVFLGGSLIDTVYLSFYYQPGGFGEFPEEPDSLILQFKDAGENWNTVWSATNTQGDVNQEFKIKMIAVADSLLFDGFQFRFRNYASIFGNNDHWNIDYVFLDDNRSYDDTIFRDVSFISDPTSFLKNYQQMPWNQFKDFQAEEINDEVSIQIVNNYNDTVNTSYSYEAFEKYSSEAIATSGLPVSINFDPASTFTIVFPTFTIPSTISGYDEDSLTTTFKYIINPASDIKRINDTLYYDKAFYNYYAYDDGTAEKAYALEGVGAKLAMHYKTNVPDTIKEIYIHWAFVDGNKSNLFFSLIVWEDIDTTLLSADESILYQADFLTPKYVDSVNGFYVYRLTDFLGNPTPVVVDGDFYVGWLQTQSDFLNVGFDVHNDASSNVYYNVSGIWQQSVLPGAIMIRPQVGGNYSVYEEISEQHSESSYINVFPNPVQNKLTVEKNISNARYQIIDYSGRILQEELLQNNSVNTANLISGFYILKIQDIQSGKVYFSKFIKQ